MIITLTTDFGQRDYYVPAIKGTLLSLGHAITLVDVTHDIDNYDIVKAAFILHNTWKNFPKGTLHIVSVNNHYQKKPTFLVGEKNGHYFLAPDNGLFSLLFETMPTAIRRMELPDIQGFPLKQLYANVTDHFANGKPLEELGVPAGQVEQRLSLQPVITGGQIRGVVIHVDKYDNAVLNITRELFEQVAKNRPFALYFKRYDPLTELCEDFADVPVGEFLCRFNTAGFLEIAVNMGKAASLIGLEQGDLVQVDFN